MNRTAPLLFCVGTALVAALPTLAFACRASEIRGLERQMTVIRARSEERGCSGIETGFFSLCAEYRARLAAAQRNLSAASQGCAATETNAQNGEDDRRRHSARRRADDGDARPVRTRFRRGDITLCVRLSDGYFFPTPNSGYVADKDVNTLLGQCRLICDEAAMDVYHVTGEEKRDDTMLSLTTGRPYAEMKNAGLYRKAQQPARCDQTRYTRLAQPSTPAAAAVAAQAPAWYTPAGATGPLTEVAGWRGTASALAAFSPPESKTPVRMVGPQFFPNH